jgi:ArsR family transcriptional regulator
VSANHRTRRDAVAPKTSDKEGAADPGPKDPDCTPSEHRARSPRLPWGNDAAFERAAGLFRAIADEARLRLLARLATGEWCVTELATVSDIPMSTVSQQLRMLRAENLVQRRRVGKHVYYRLGDGHVTELIRSALEHSSEPIQSDE